MELKNRIWSPKKIVPIPCGTLHFPLRAAVCCDSGCQVMRSITRCEYRRLGCPYIPIASPIHQSIRFVQCRSCNKYDWPHCYSNSLLLHNGRYIKNAQPQSEGRVTDHVHSWTSHSRSFITNSITMPLTIFYPLRNSLIRFWTSLHWINTNQYGYETDSTSSRLCGQAGLEWVWRRWFRWEWAEVREQYIISPVDAAWYQFYKLCTLPLTPGLTENREILLAINNLEYQQSS